jgi:steroid 5-alpha reductase family enzyme
MKQKHFIDIHKGLNSLFILFLMYYFDSWNNLIAWIYLALHGPYGYLWILKSKIFPDKQWENKTSIGYGLVIWVGLSLYWISPYIIITGNHMIPFEVGLSPVYIFFCISLFILGVFLHFTSDMQKYITLKLNPGNLIQDEMFQKVRNTNYLGELLIYLGFTLLAIDWAPIIALFLFIAIIWIPNMIKKDKSLSRYSEFENYKKKSYKFIPYIW